MADCFINGHMYGPKENCIFCGAESGTSQPLMELREIALGALSDPIDPQTPIYDRDLVVQAQVLLKLIDHWIESTRKTQVTGPETATLRQYVSGEVFGQIQLDALPAEGEELRLDGRLYIVRHVRRELEIGVERINLGGGCGG